MKFSRALAVLAVGLIAALLASCGYHFGEGAVLENYATIEIPFVDNDVEGSLTQALINDIATQTTLSYVNQGGDLTLNARVVEVLESDVGFRYDQKKSGKRIDYIIPTEARLELKVEFSLVDSRSGEFLLGPLLISASYDFDHDYYTSPNSVNIFSLGQLTNYDEAYDAALKPLNKKMAAKIVDYIKAIW